MSVDADEPVVPLTSLEVFFHQGYACFSSTLTVCHDFVNGVRISSIKPSSRVARVSEMLIWLNTHSYLT